MAEPMTADELAEAQRAEYSRYVAKEPINIGGVRAFNAGDHVPVGHITSGVVDKDAVVGANTKAAAAAADKES